MMGSKNGKIPREKRKKMTWIKDYLGPAIVVLGAVGIAYTSLSIAQKDIEDLEASDLKQDKILAEIPAMAKDIEHILGAVVEIKGFMKEVRIEDKRNREADLKSHHKH